jgi:hypothetical protein
MMPKGKEGAVIWKVKGVKQWDVAVAVAQAST